MLNPLKLIYPDQCVSCGGLVEASHALCGPCWSETPFLDGLTCDGCGVPLLGDERDGPARCDDCLNAPPVWGRGRAPLHYGGKARRMVLGLKHGDRHDLARPLGRWMVDAGRDLLVPGAMVVPVPLHWTRMVRRRFNQSALLAREIARLSGTCFAPEALVRSRRTAAMEDMSPDQRMMNLTGAIRPHPKRGQELTGRPVVLIDDVLTTGATLTAAAIAAQTAGAARVDILVAARVFRA